MGPCYPAAVVGAFAEAQYVTGLLSRIDRFMQIALDRRLRRYGLSLAQYLVIVRLWRAEPTPVSQAALAADLELERSSISALVTSLERAGLVVRTTDEHDARRRLVHLAPDGTRLEGPVFELIAEYERDLLAVLQPGERADLEAVLERVLDRARWLRDQPATQ